MPRHKQLLLFGFFVSLVLIGASWWGARIWFANTIVVPARGGELREAFVGSPRHINPVLTDTTESEGAIEALVFSGLFKTDTQGGIMPDLAAEYTISENRREYFVTIHENARWHDGAAVQVDDVLFTLSLIRNPALQSPLAFAWQGVEVEKISDRTLKFILEEPYEHFLQNLTFRILPQHLWAQVPLGNFHLAELNLRPIGSGPYRFSAFRRDALGNIISYEFSANPEYFREGPHVNRIYFLFYQNQEEALLAWKRGEVNLVGGIDGLGVINGARVVNVQRIPTTRQFNVFFNTSAALLRDSRVRQALIAAVDREIFAINILAGSGRMLDVSVPHDETAARALLAAAGWGSPNEDGILTRRVGRERVTLTLNLTVPAGEMHQRTAQFLIEHWRAIGIDARILSLDAPAISGAIIERNYDMILFGTLFGVEPDLFPFWHSSQINHPGLNLSRLESSRLDTALLRSRREVSREARLESRAEAMRLIQEAHAALFLYSPYYFYAVSPRISWGDAQISVIGSPDERFNRIAEWFIHTKRVWKR